MVVWTHNVRIMAMTAPLVASRRGKERVSTLPSHRRSERATTSSPADVTVLLAAVLARNVPTAIRTGPRRPAMPADATHEFMDHDAYERCRSSRSSLFQTFLAEAKKRDCLPGLERENRPLNGGPVL